MFQLAYICQVLFKCD